MFLVFFAHEACGVLAPRPGIESAPPALEGEVLTTGPTAREVPGAALVVRKAFLGSGGNARPLPSPPKSLFCPL